MVWYVWYGMVWYGGPLSTCTRSNWSSRSKLVAVLESAWQRVHSLGQFKRAIEYHKKDLVIALVTVLARRMATSR